jgi:hypothetical protein
LRELALLLPIVSACGDDGGADPAETGSSGASSPESTSADDGPTDPDDGADTSSEGGTQVEASTDDTQGTDGSSAGSGTSDDSATSSETGSPIECRLLIVEVLYDVEDLNDGWQWVELYNYCDEPVDLSTYGLSYAGLDYGEPNLKQLEGTIDPLGCYVVGGPNSAPINGQPDFELSDDFAPDLDIAEFAGSAVALFDVPAAEITTDSVPIDAVVYGPNNDNGLIDETGLPVPAPHVGNAPLNGSIQRTSVDATWITSRTPAPNDCPEL